MKGLLLKDLMMMLKYGRLTLLACLIFSLVGWFGEPNLFMMLYPVIIGSVMAQSLISYDERSGWDRYCDALPVSRAGSRIRTSCSPSTSEGWRMFISF